MWWISNSAMSERIRHKEVTELVGTVGLWNTHEK